MYTIDYTKIIEEIDSLLTIYRENDFVYLLYPHPPKNGNILIQEKEDCIILWSNEYKTKPYKDVLAILCARVELDIIVPFIETEEEYRTVTSLGGSPIDFDAPDSENLCKDYGSLVIRKRNNDGV